VLEVHASRYAEKKTSWQGQHTGQTRYWFLFSVDELIRLCFKTCLVPKVASKHQRTTPLLRPVHKKDAWYLSHTWYRLWPSTARTAEGAPPPLLLLLVGPQPALWGHASPRGGGGAATWQTREFAKSQKIWQRWKEAIFNGLALITSRQFPNPKCEQVWHICQSFLSFC